MINVYRMTPYEAIQEKKQETREQEVTVDKKKSQSHMCLASNLAINTPLNGAYRGF